MTTITGTDLLRADAEFQRTKYNDPTKNENVALVKAIGDATDSFEANALAYKIIATAELTKDGTLPSPGEGDRLSLGEHIPYQQSFICVDLLDELTDGTVIAVRFLADKERMYLEEWPFWDVLAQQDKVKRVLFVHQGALHPMEERFIRQLIEALPQKVELMQVAMPAEG